MFTCNNYTDKHIECLVPGELIKYVCYGVETAPSTGTKHLQGYIELSRPSRLAALKQFGNSFHWEPRNGTQDQAIEYCQKEGSFIELGEKKSQGARNDLARLKAEYQKGGRWQALPQVENWQQFQFVSKALPCILQKRRDWKPEVWWLYGASGSYKTQSAIQFAKDYVGERYYLKAGTSKWWNMYDLEEFVIIDDLKPNVINISELLNWLDSCRCEVETKGGTLQLMAKTIICTSILHPDYFDTDDKELRRRITHVIKFPLLHRVTEVGGNTIHRPL